MNKEAIQPGQLMRILPTAKVNPRLQGQLVIVEQVRAWGILGVVILEDAVEAKSHYYPVRVDWKGLEELK